MKRKRLLFFVVLILIPFFWIVLRLVRISLTCSDKEAIQFLDELCTDFSQGVVTGSLCAPLCTHKEIKYSMCLGHGVKPHVLSAVWKGERIILKVAITSYDLEVENIGQFLGLKIPEGASMKSFSITADVFLKQVCDTIYFDFAQANPDLVTQMVGRVLSECDIKQDGLLHIDEVISCTRLLETKEYSFFQLLRGNSAFPRVLGACGKVYAVEYAPSEPFLADATSWSEVRDWNFRAQLAIALLEMVESLEKTDLGTVYLCDLQESNFGVVRRKDGSLVAKAIDMDISFFEQTLLKTAVSEQDNSCSSDEECEMVGCLIKCNMETKKCAGVLSSNNLRGVCVHFFKLFYSFHPALLLNPPRTVADKLDSLLNQCVLSQTPHTDMDLLRQLRTLLESTIVS